MDKVSIQVGRRTGVEVVTDEELERQRQEDLAEQRAQNKPALEGVKHYDIFDLVKEIREDSFERPTEKQRQEVRDLQRERVEFKMDPGREAMIKGQGDYYRPDREEIIPPGPASELNTQAFLGKAIHAGREKAERAREDKERREAIRDCAACFRLRQRRDRRRYCDKHRHRSTHDAELMAVPLCPHRDLRLFWPADDPANKKGSWRIDVPKVHKEDVREHEGCKAKGEVKSVEKAVQELIKQLEKYMQRKGLRAPNVERLVRGLPAVWWLLKRDDTENKGRVMHVNPTLPREGTDPYSTGGLVPLTGQFTGAHKKVRAEDEKGDAKKKEKVGKVTRNPRAKSIRDVDSDAEARLAAKAAAAKKTLLKQNPAEPENRFKLSETTTASKKPVNTPKLTENKAAKPVLAAKPTPKKPASKKDKPDAQAPSKKSKLSEENIYDSDEGLEDDEVSSPVPTKQGSSKRKLKESGGGEKPASKKLKENPKSEVTKQPTAASKKLKATPKNDIPPTPTAPPARASAKRKISATSPSANEGEVEVEQPAPKKWKVSPKDEVTQQPTPETGTGTTTTAPASSDEVPSEKIREQETLAKKRKGSSASDVAAKKRKVSIAEQAAEIKATETETLTVEDTSLIAVTAEVQQPTPSHTSSTTPVETETNETQVTETLDTATASSIAIPTEVQQPSATPAKPRSQSMSSTNSLFNDNDENAEAEMPPSGRRRSSRGGKVEDEVDYGSSGEESEEE